MFEDLGLGDFDLAVYRACVLQPDCTIEEVAKQLDADTRAVTAAMQRLLDSGLAVASIVGPSPVRPVSPALGFQAAVADAERRLDQRQHRLRELRRAIQHLESEYQNIRWQRSTLEFERLASQDEIFTRLEELAHTTTSAVRSMTRDTRRREAMANSSRALRAARENGVTMRSLYTLSVRSDRQAMDLLEQLHRAGDNMRAVPALASRMEIFDNRVAVVAADPDDPASGAVVVTNRSLLNSLVAFFDMLWRTAEPLFGEDPQPQDPGGPRVPTAVERELIRLLAAGNTDEGVARALGVSSRTVRRMIADLSQEADASGRFQLGAMAERLGWLDTE